MLASGFAGLGYQIVWTQQCALWLGHEAAAVLAVVTAFFGGLAVGAVGIGGLIERSARPLRWYAACELLIALWSLALAWWMGTISQAMLDAIGTQPTPLWQWTVALCGTFVMLLPATVAMGATLPAMERAMSQMSHHARPIAVLYAANTFGAVVGVLAAAFWLVPEFGLLHTAGVCAGLNLLCAAATLRFTTVQAIGARPTALQTTSTAAKHAPPAPTRMLITLAATGMLGIGYEVLVVRVLSQVAEDTVYTYALLLAVYLVGSALGAAGYQRLRVAGRIADAAWRDRLLCMMATACLLGMGSLWAAPRIKTMVLTVLGAGMASALMAEALLAVAAFGLPTVLMGALFSHLSTQARDGGIPFGRALGVNTWGAAAAPFLFGVLLVPALGPMLALLIVAGGYLALLTPRSWLRPVAWLPAGAVLALALWAPPLAFIDVPEGGHVLSYRDGAMASVSVVEDAEGVSRLRIDNRQQEGSSSSLLADARQALLPLLLHPDPRRALFLGLGTGVTAASAAQEATLQVDAVELLPEVISASAQFAHVVGEGGVNPRLHLIAADARRYVRSAKVAYDLIVSDNFHPARSGSGALYTVEHFRAVRERLNDDGVFCQWLPLHQLDLVTLRSIVQSFIAVYPNGAAMLATNSLDTPVLGLVARHDGGRFALQQVRTRLNHHRLPERLADFGLADDLAVLGNVIAGPQALAHFAGDAPLNTDDHPVVAYRAPRLTYAPDSQPRERLLWLLQQLRVEPGEVIDADTEPGWAQQLVAYRAARDRFIAVGQGVQASDSLEQMLRQVREPLIEVLRISPDFRPAYDPLLQMAMALARTDGAGARQLLSELQQVQPARPEAALAYRQLAAPRP